MKRLKSQKNYLLITLDSCRYDTFISARIPNMKGVGQVYKAFSNGNFTYPSHAAIFVGFTPGNPQLRETFVNPKFGKIFKIKTDGDYIGPGMDHVVLDGKNIVDGFKREGYITIGTAAMDWFDPESESGRTLMSDFDYFLYSKTDFLKQKEYVIQKIAECKDKPRFVFMNIGETHVPYYFKGASWSRKDNPCVPFGSNNSFEKSSFRQRKCLEFIDSHIAEILALFKKDNVVICSDHGDCWGEDGLWEHAIHHEKTVTVPLLFKLEK
jgi:membrane-anchored protein YejM (alkaline phosphatase superfamily)